MTRLATVFCAVFASSILFAGCASPDAHTFVIESNDEVLLGVLGPTAIEPAAADADSIRHRNAGNVFAFGAGDALGRSLFTTYVAHLRSGSDKSARLANVPPE